MIESAARVERIVAEPSSRPGYTWEVSQKPLSVYLPFELIDRLEGFVVESFRSLTSRGSEIGGLLLGRAVPGNPALVSVEDFELVACDYSRGPLYRLSDGDMGRFEQAMERHGGGSGARVVGFFRSHTRKGLSLDPDDLAFLDARFHDANQIALLVRPYATKASTAGVFIRENGVVHSEASYLEFPFRSSQLTPSAPPLKIEPVAMAEPPAPIVPVAPIAPPAPKPPIRGQIVSIAPRREAAPPVVPASEPAHVPVPAIEASAPAAAPTPAVAPKASAELAMRGEEKSVVRQAEPADLVPATASTDSEVAEIPAEAAVGESPAGRRGSVVVWAVAVLALVALGAGGYVLYPGFHKTSPSVPAGDQSPLNLRVEHSGPDLLLTWNRDAAGVKNAVHAVLSISDGERHENYDMDPGQLFNGSIVYSPLTPDVSFRLEVTGQNQVKIASESVRVLRTRPSPMDDPKAASKTQSSTASGKDTAAPASQPAAEEPPAPEKAAAPAAPARTFDSSSLSKRLRPPSATDLPDAPMVGGPGSAPALPGANLGGIAPAPKQAAPPPSASSRASGGQISAAELVFQRKPEYPKIAQQMGVRGTVELSATIGTDGRVKTVKVLKGPPMLQKPAQDAVMQWVYKPTLLNGTPVENETHISINFSSDK